MSAPAPSPLDGLLEFLAPVTAAGTDATGLAALLTALGWDLGAAAGVPLARVEGALAACTRAAERIGALAAGGNPALDDIVTALGATAKAVAELRELSQVWTPPAELPADLAERFVADLLMYLPTRWLRERHPRLAELLALLGVYLPAEASAPEAPIRAAATGAIIRTAGPRATLDTAAIRRLLDDPPAALRARFDPDAGAAIGRRLDSLARLLLPALADALRGLGLDAQSGIDPTRLAELPTEQRALAGRLLRVQQVWRLDDLVPDGAGAATAGAAIVLTEDAGRPAVAVNIYGGVNQRAPLGAWEIALAMQGLTPGLILSPAGARLADGGAAPGLQTALSLTHTGDAAAEPPVGPELALPGTAGTRVALGAPALTASLHAGASGTVLETLAETGASALVVSGGDGDSFLARVLPPDMRVPFQLGLGWRSGGGLYLRGGAGSGAAGLEATLPVNADLLGLLTIDSAFFALRADAAGIRGAAAATATVRLGPVTATVERFGIEAALSFPPDGGNLGVADLALDFKPPSGAALAIDAGVVVGGGYLFFDPVREQYAGAVQLELAETLSLTAFGLLTTRMPDGSRGFSLLVLIAARFSPPVQLGYGFTLNGIGGLVGVNRTVAVDTLRAGLRTGTLGSVLFPADPLRNAPQIVSNLQAIFPPAEGRFLFGPMVILGWGTPTLLTLELGLILELPAPVRLFILGRLRVLLPEERQPIVRLQLDALGLIDFASGDVALDAVLYDSLIAQFAVTGEMALRANWGSNPNFVLAIGGFHPRFQAPPAFPALARVAISLATGDNPRLRLEAYLALTTNTLQFGARLDLYASAGAFSIEGVLGFDALIQFDPFGFVVDLAAAVALKYQRRSVMSIDLGMTLAGPTPWHARGRVRFKVLFISGSIGFDVRFGRREAPPLPPPVRIRPLLLAALRDPGNWATQLPAGEHPLVSLRDRPGAAGTLVHPLAALGVSQRVAPLGREITRFGNSAPEGERRFTLGVVGADGRVRTTPEEGVEPLADAFAPAQFREMSDDERLAAPAFERLPAGVRFASRAFTCGPAVVEPDIRYDTGVVYEASAARAATGAARAARSPGAAYRVTAAFLERVAPGGAAGLAPLARTGAVRYAAGAPARGFALREPVFAAAVVAAGGAATPLDTAGALTDGAAVGDFSYMAAAEVLDRRLAEHPEERPLLRVVALQQGVEA